MPTASCTRCGGDLPPPTGRGRPRRLCDGCRRTRRERYFDDVERERERARSYYAANRERVLERANDRYWHMEAES